METRDALMPHRPLTSARLEKCLRNEFYNATCTDADQTQYKKNYTLYMSLYMKGQH